MPPEDMKYFIPVTSVLNRKVIKLCKYREGGKLREIVGWVYVVSLCKCILCSQWLNKSEGEIPFSFNLFQFHWAFF